MRKTLVVLMLNILSLIYASGAFAAAPQLQNLNPENVDVIFKTFGALGNFRPLEPASAWADLFGVAVGVIGQASPAKRLKSVIPNSGDVPSMLPDANLFLGAQLPFGLGVELGIFPTTTVKDITLRQYSGNVKWTVTKLFFGDIIPLDIALRGGISNTLVAFKYNYQGVQDAVDFKSNTLNFSVSGSKRFLFLEPYIGAGLASLSGDLNNEGKLQLLNREFDVKSSVSKSYSSFLAYAGLQIHIFAVNVTAQADYQFGAANFAAKLGLKF